MSLFNFFSRSKSVNTDNNPGGPVIAQAPKPINRELFVDDQEPVQSDTANKKENPIQVFMNQHFEWQAYNDGYGFPDAEYLEQKLRIIRAEFRIAVDKCLDTKRTELADLKQHIIQTRGISERLESQLAEKIKSIEVIIHELDLQKILSIEDEGIVGTAVHSYRAGFLKGVEQFQKEKLFAGTTGLFN